MAGVSLNYAINNEALLDMLTRLHSFDGTQMFDEIGAYLDSETSRRFAESEDWLGAPLIPSQRALEEGGTTLVDKAHMRDSFTHFAYNDSVEHGSNMIYTAIQMFGGEAGRGHAVELPARQVIGVNDDDDEMILDIAEEYLRRVMQ